MLKRIHRKNCYFIFLIAFYVCKVQASEYEYQYDEYAEEVHKNYESDHVDAYENSGQSSGDGRGHRSGYGSGYETYNPDDEDGSSDYYYGAYTGKFGSGFSSTLVTSKPSSSSDQNESNAHICDNEKLVLGPEKVCDGIRDCYD